MRSDDPLPGWTTRRLGDLVQIFDGPHATPGKTDEGPIFLGISSLVNGRLDLSNVVRLSEKDFVQWTRRVAPQPNDVVFSYETRLGEAALIPTGLRCCLGRRMGLLRVRSSDLLPHYLLYAYLGPQFQSVIRDRTIHGSTVDRIPLKMMDGFPIVLPPVGEQARILSILTALDDKIASNRRLAQLLEETADALFRARFVTFARAQDSEPDERPLREVTLLIQRGRAPSYCEEGGTLVINQKCVRDGRIDFGKARRHDSVTRAVSEERMLLVGDVLVNSTGVGTLGRTAVVRWVPEPATVDGHVTIVRPNPSAVVPAYLAHELATREADIEGLAEGSTGQTELNRSRLAGLAVRVPSRSAQEEFARISSPATAQIATCEREVLLLAAIRDLLLPKLVSGQLRVPDSSDPDEMIQPAVEALQAAAS